ncbi:DNA repair protein RecN [Flavobacterium sp. 20NA77.7]|uniref:DNA repair protein RecN n=1 Tax=Flavobacterium nakdongensis TaxID=3073563 RepID=A0ABY9R9Y6_9FLAO|nr:DNA repair protein RecN [Flavobacterium sp. 20NA77.7]WMW77155.1 DNA repair protein RecN [Flavobacterium sp. 20NA77.7]
MLLSLSVQNYALIEHLEIDFSANFSTITGETGAGKSILLGALGLIMGNRADLSALKDKEKKCIVEATFKIEAYNLQQLFADNDLDYEATTIIRREILPSGKSRAFVNDTPTNLAELQLLTAYLIDIHSQHDTKELEQQEYQLSILDAMGNNVEVLKEYTAQLSTYKSLVKQLEILKEEQRQSSKEEEYNIFLLQELEAANLKNDEQEILEEELETLNNVEVIHENLAKTIALSQEEQIGFLNTLKESKNALQKIASFSSKYEELVARIQSVIIELEDVSDLCAEYVEKVIFDPERMNWLTSRLQLIYDLQKKHYVQTVSELLEIQASLTIKVGRVTGLGDEIQALSEKIESQEKQVINLATILSNNRAKAIPDFSSKAEVILKELGIPNAAFQINLIPSISFLTSGKDELQLLFSANKGSNFGTLKKVASGGEMSRIMLAIKSILADFTQLPTIVFDEIDTGVSGEIALKMAEIMKQMSQKRQVFAITHLPQIAAKGNQHYKVSKFIQGETTLSKIEKLASEARIHELAEMLAGKNYTESAITHAKTLLN